MIPALTIQQMVEVDRLMIDEFGILLIQMMEIAGRDLADLVRRKLGGEVRGVRVALICGAGNNGGGGMVAARHLHNWGADVLLKVVAEPKKLKEIPLHQLRILKAMGIMDEDRLNLDRSDLVVDSLIGYGLTGVLSEPVAAWIERINASNRPVLSLDVPSGLDADTGAPEVPCVRASATLALALPKAGLLTPQAKPYVGELYVADIGVPPELYAAPTLGLDIGAYFVRDTILRLTD